MTLARHEAEKSRSGSSVTYAIERAFRRPVAIHSDDLEFLDGDPGLYTLPLAARGWLNRFDAEEPVEPFSFEIDLDAWEPARAACQPTHGS